MERQKDLLRKDEQRNIVNSNEIEGDEEVFKKYDKETEDLCNRSTSMLWDVVSKGIELNRQKELVNK